MVTADDDYYAQISIEIDGWLWNLADASLQKSELFAAFPSAERLLRRWDHDSEMQAA
jgi:hypothetical protein